MTRVLFLVLLPATLLLVAFAWAEPALNYNADPWDVPKPPFKSSRLMPLESLSGGTEFYVDTQSIQPDGHGGLTFNVMTYAMEQQAHGGYILNKGNTIDCRKGLYRPSYARQEVNAAGDTLSDNGTALGADVTLRNDGKGLYQSIKDVCKKYSGLQDNDLSSW